MNPTRFLPRFRRAYRMLPEYAERETWSRSSIEKYQLGRLNELWQHATKHVDYYRELARTNALPPRFEDLDEFRSRVPVLPKAVIRADRNALLSERAERGGWKYTGGSTAAPTPVYRSHEAHFAMLRSRYRFYQMWDIDIFDRWAFLWGHAASFAPGLAGWKDRILTPLKDRLRNRIRLSAYDMGPDELRRHLDRIRAYRPAAIYGYSMAGYLLAVEAEKIGFDCDSLKMINLTSEPVHDYIRETVERAFGVPALIEYGSIECGFLAGEWPDRTLRVREDEALLESVPRDDGRFDIVVTVLGNPSFPLLRYELGDVTDRPLVFPERGFAILHNVGGRNNDMITTRSGRILHSHIFEHVLQVHKNFRRWRVQQAADGSVAVLIESLEPVGREVLRGIEAQLADMFDGCPVTANVVDELPPTPAGKHRAVVSEFRLADAPNDAAGAGSTAG